jgi:hypothetical protein
MFVALYTKDMKKVWGKREAVCARKPNCLTGWWCLTGRGTTVLGAGHYMSFRVRPYGSWHIVLIYGQIVNIGTILFVNDSRQCMIFVYSVFVSVAQVGVQGKGKALSTQSLFGAAGMQAAENMDDCSSCRIREKGTTPILYIIRCVRNRRKNK